MIRDNSKEDCNKCQTNQLLERSESDDGGKTVTHHSHCQTCGKTAMVTVGDNAPRTRMTKEIYLLQRVGETYGDKPVKSLASFDTFEALLLFVKSNPKLWNEYNDPFCLKIIHNPDSMVGFPYGYPKSYEDYDEDDALQDFRLGFVLRKKAE